MHASSKMEQVTWIQSLHLLQRNRLLEFSATQEMLQSLQSGKRFLRLASLAAFLLRGIGVTSSPSVVASAVESSSLSSVLLLAFESFFFLCFFFLLCTYAQFFFVSLWGQKHRANCWSPVFFAADSIGTGVIASRTVVGYWLTLTFCPVQFEDRLRVNIATKFITWKKLSSTSKEWF